MHINKTNTNKNTFKQKSTGGNHQHQQQLIKDSPVKTLIVKYIPRNEQSNTKKLLDAYREEIGNSNVGARSFKRCTRYVDSQQPASLYQQEYHRTKIVML